MFAENNTANNICICKRLGYTYYGFLERDQRCQVSVHNAKMPLPTYIEIVTGESSIASVWTDHYNSVFNSTDGGCYTANFSKCNDAYEDRLVLPNETAKAINDFDGNK